MKSVIKLNLINDLERSIASAPTLLHVILGPRQVGKTTSILHFLEKNYPNQHVYLSADRMFNANASWIHEGWQEARRTKSVLVIDEIQKIENWSEIVKSLWDEDKRNKTQLTCILLGSSSLGIQKGLTESLTGRFRLIRAFHWNFSESKKGYGLTFDQYLKYGGYPGSYPFIQNQREWSDYVKHSIVETVVEKDILQNHTVKSPALFRQAFDLLVSYPAQEISYTKLLGQLQDKGNVELIKHYIRLYEGAFLMKALEKFSTNSIKVRSSSPKILLLAPALHFTGVLDEYTGEEKGRVFESVVGSQLMRTGFDLFYWRENNDEVDYVVKEGRKIWAVEVKSGRKKSAKGLEKFKERFPHAKILMINPENYEIFEKDPVKFLTE